jgi:hypothetical protein
MSFQGLSRILASAGISPSQEEYILNAFKNLSSSPPIQEDLQVSFNSSCQFIEEIEESCNNFNGEQSLEFKVEECIIEEDIQSNLNLERNQQCHDPIEEWFQSRIKLHHSSILLIELSKQLVYHAWVNFNVYFSELSMNILLLLLHTWLH